MLIPELDQAAIVQNNLDEYGPDAAAMRWLSLQEAAQTETIRENLLYDIRKKGLLLFNNTKPFHRISHPAAVSAVKGHGRASSSTTCATPGASSARQGRTIRMSRAQARSPSHRPRTMQTTSKNSHSPVRASAAASHCSPLTRPSRSSNISRNALGNASISGSTPTAPLPPKKSSVCSLMQG